MLSPADNSIQTPGISENAETPECLNQELMKENQRVIECASPVLVTESGDQGSSSKCHTPNIVSNEMTREDIISAANALIDNLNNKRKRDTQLLDNFKKALELQVQRTCTMVEERMFHVYEEQGKVVQQKLQELFAGIERIAKTEAELAEFREALRLLYTDINASPE
ncbi:synaptonemal complex central element protein 2-like [Pecten maximus]|uniref:synaptonemal complex central element protein 2-like n=1 Tax=Pecten maximus TaxID=6579 RepID=UPI0014585D5B|nr:synaptonemal complex central element protein 2-like [Pecten maximus]XP_033737210.1 synaptonemal complex central element protein 2-like [Pecten maximus]XP_033737211.1 synaptonemal complex central element protein 2-like [Pecten maximus]